MRQERLLTWAEGARPRLVSQQTLSRIHYRLQRVSERVRVRVVVRVAVVRAIAGVLGPIRSRDILRAPTRFDPAAANERQ